MQKYKIIEICNPNEKNIEEKLQEVFIIFMTEKILNPEENNNSKKDIEKSDERLYNHRQWDKRKLLLSERRKNDSNNKSRKIHSGII